MKTLKGWLFDLQFERMLRKAAKAIVEQEEREVDEFFRQVEGLPPPVHSERHKEAMRRLVEEAKVKYKRR